MIIFRISITNLYQHLQKKIKILKQNEMFQMLQIESDKSGKNIFKETEHILLIYFFNNKKKNKETGFM